MKTLLITIGFLLVPVTASAQCPLTPQAQALASATPIGNYAQKVVERVNNGITKAKNSSGGQDIVTIFNLHYLSLIESFFYMLVDTDLRAVEYKRDLTTINSCLHYDLAILEAKIEEVRCETIEAYKRKSPDGIEKLKALAGFLNQRYKHLIKGGMEPLHEDASWPYHYQFDDPFDGWCCTPDQDGSICSVQDFAGCANKTLYPTKDACLRESVCTFAEDDTLTAKYATQCPFDSDYLTASTNGYGCDISVLEKIDEGAIPGVDAEIKALRELADTRDQFLEDIDHIKATTETMDTLMNENMLSDDQREALEHFGETAVDDIDHKRVFGCNADLTPEEWGEREPPDAKEDNAGFEGELTDDTKPSKEWIRVPLRSAFYFAKDELEIWKTFFRQQLEWAKKREYPDYLKNPDEFEEEADRRDAMEADYETFRLISIPRNYVRDIWNKIHGQQATDETALLTKTQDAGLQIRDALTPVRSAMKKNADLVDNAQGPLRQFVINYAYYLRRSCIYRPCNEKLETIIKIVLSDECFPYSKGEIGSWEACKDAVELLQ